MNATLSTPVVEQSPSITETNVFSLEDRVQRPLTEKNRRYELPDVPTLTPTEAAKRLYRYMSPQIAKKLITDMYTLAQKKERKGVFIVATPFLPTNEQREEKVSSTGKVYEVTYHVANNQRFTYNPSQFVDTKGNPTFHPISEPYRSVSAANLEAIWSSEHSHDGARILDTANGRFYRAGAHIGIDEKGLHTEILGLLREKNCVDEDGTGTRAATYAAAATRTVKESLVHNVAIYAPHDKNYFILFTPSENAPDTAMAHIVTTGDEPPSGTRSSMQQREIITRNIPGTQHYLTLETLSSSDVRKKPHSVQPTAYAALVA